jgi:C1A family cysteine protease
MNSTIDTLNLSPMKKVILLSVLLVLLITVNGFTQFKSFPNPSVAYIEKMGYTYQISKDALGNENGVCVFPDGTKADAWAFLQGKVGHQFSYCVKNGYTSESREIDHGTYKEIKAFCTKTTNGKKEEVPMVELMDRNGDPLIPEQDRPAASMEDDLSTESNLEVPSTLPTAFDWRSFNGHSYIGPVRNQGGCGSCYAFGALSSAESVYNVATGNYDGNCVDLSESFLIWCMGKVAPYSYHFSGCNGSDYANYELKALVDSGVTYEANFPYQQTDPGTCTHWNDPRIKFTSWARVSCQNIDAIKTAIMTYGAVDASVMTTVDFQGYTGGVYTDNNTSCPAIPCYYTGTNHAISLVGWGFDEVAGEYWILRNSWGSTWGESGYMKISLTSAAVACAVSYMTYVPPVPPVATTTAATSITTSGATLNGTVNANNKTTTVTFEYGVTTSYGTIVNATPNTVTGTTVTSVTAAIAGLAPVTTYHYRVIATNSVGTATGADMTFTTPALPLPIATTAAATTITASGATLNGTVNANGYSTTVVYEYGLTTAYGSTINATPNTVTGSTVTNVIAAVTGLTGSTLYHYRVKATSSIGTTHGNDLTFTTLQSGCIDNYEPNNTLATAIMITPEVQIYALIGASGDIDWFKVNNLTTKRNMKVQLTNLPADYDLQLYKANGSLLKTSANRGTTSEVINYNTSTVATYYIKVYGYNGAFNALNCYALKVSLSSTTFKSMEETEETEIAFEPELNVYPNPTTGKVTLEYFAPVDGKIKVNIMSASGNVILTQDFQVVEGVNNLQYDVANKPEGIYIVQVIANQESLFRKLILRK